MASTKKSIARGVQAIAAFEAAKGLLVLGAGFGLLQLMHKSFAQIGFDILDHLNMNPASKVPQVFLEALHRVDNHHENVVLLAIGAGVYSLLRFAEAYGLWRGRRWAAWIAVVSTAIYLPVEVYHLAREFSWIKIAITTFNLALLVYVIVKVLRHHSKPHRVS